MAKWGSFVWGDGTVWKSGEEWRITLIYDRTKADVNYATTLKRRIQTNGWNSLSAEEKLLWLAGPKGFYFNYTDLNRVGKAVQYLANLLIGYGYPVVVSPKTDWTKNDTFNSVQISDYLDNVAVIKARFYGTTDLPAAMNDLDYEGANNIEKLLTEVERYISNMEAVWGGVYYGNTNLDLLRGYNL